MKPRVFSYSQILVFRRTIIIAENCFSWVTCSGYWWVCRNLNLNRNIARHSPLMGLYVTDGRVGLVFKLAWFLCLGLTHGTEFGSWFGMFGRCVPDDGSWLNKHNVRIASRLMRRNKNTNTETWPSHTHAHTHIRPSPLERCVSNTHNTYLYMLRIHQRDEQRKFLTRCTSPTISSSPFVFSYVQNFRLMRKLYTQLQKYILTHAHILSKPKHLCFGVCGNLIIKRKMYGGSGCFDFNSSWVDENN